MNVKTPSPLPQHPVVERDWNKILLYAAIIVAAGLFVAAPAFHGTWLWDDDQEITANPAIRTGFEGLKTIWKGDVGADYLPIKTTIIWLEWQIWQDDNTCYHIINAIFHVLNGLLIWKLMSQLRVKWAWIVGLLFVIHPVLVESVAWVSEQKNTISLIFMLLSAITYINYHERGKTGSLIASILWFALALLSKSAVVMLPFCFILYAWWRDNKFELGDIPAFGGLLGLMAAVWGGGMIVCKTVANMDIAASNYYYLAIGSVVAAAFFYLWWILNGERSRYAQKFLFTVVPYFVLMVIAAVITIHFQHKNAIGAEVIPVGGLKSRLVIAGMAVFFYLKQCAWPFEPYGLIPIYPRWEVPESPSLVMYLPWVAFIALVCLFWMYRKTWGRHAILGMGFFFGFLVPVLGFVDMSYMRITWVADHFLYIPVIGVIALIVAGAAKLYDMISPKGKPFAMGAGIFAIGLVTLDANLYSDVFLNETNMWRYTLSKNPNAWQAHSRYGKVLLDSGNRDAAYFHIQQSNRLRPDLAETNNNMGVLLLQKGRSGEALPYFGRAVRLMPIGAFLVNYANALTQANQGATAAPLYEKLIKGDGGAALANLLAEKGKAALEKIFSERGGVTIADLLAGDDGEALRKLLEMKTGEGYKASLSLQGGVALDALIRMRLSDALDDSIRKKAVEDLEKMVQKNGGAALERFLKGKNMAALEAILKMDAGPDLSEIFKMGDSNEAYLALRKLRGSDVFENMVAIASEDPVLHMYGMPGGDTLRKLIGSKGPESLAIMRQMEGTQAFGILKEMMGGDPITWMRKLNGGNPIIFTNYGVALLQANRRDDAINALQHALKLNPNMADARRNLEAVLGKTQPAPVQQDLRFPMSNVPGSTGPVPQIPSIFLNK